MVPIGKKYADILINIIFSITPIFETIGADLLETRRESKKWSGKEILGHLIDSAYHNHRRIVKAQNQEKLVCESYDQDLWVRTNKYRSREAAEILETFIIVQKHMALMLGSLSNEVIVKKYKDNNLSEIVMNAERCGDNASLSLLIWDYLFHIEHHLRQIIPEYISVCPEDYFK